jgi:HEPN domain-containing protein
MPHDPELLAEVREWLQRAMEDLREAEHDLVATPPLVRGAVFHCQQAAEKSLKAFLTWHNTPFRKTHLLEEVGEQCLGIDATLKAIIDRAVPLSQYAWRYRYPGEPTEPPREEAEAALAIAREVYDAILARLPDEAHP